MTSVNDLLGRVLRFGTTPQVQFLAWDAATASGKKGQSLLRALASTPHLEDELRLAIARCNCSEARIRLWERKDISRDLVREFLPKERSAQAVQAMFDALQSRDAIVDALRVNMNAAHTQAVLRTAGKWQWPADILIRASRADPVKASHVDWKKVDVTPLAQERTLDPMVRLAACTSDRTPAAVVAAELPGIIDELELRSGNTDWFRAGVLVKKISKRPADPAVGQAITTAAATHEWFPQEAVWAVESWDEVGPAADNPTQALEYVTSPEALHGLWDAMNSQQRQDHLRAVVNHEWCDKALLGAIRAQFTLEGFNLFGWKPCLWNVQDGELFADAASHVRLHGLLEFALEHRAHAAPFEELLRPFFDRLLAMNWADAEGDLATLTASEAFPRHWLREMPLASVAKLLKAYPGEDHAWVAQEMTSLFEAVSHDPKVYLPILNGLPADQFPLHTAVRTALASTEA